MLNVTNVWEISLIVFLEKRCITHVVISISLSNERVFIPCLYLVGFVLFFILVNAYFHYPVLFLSELLGILKTSENKCRLPSAKCFGVGRVE